MTTTSSVTGTSSTTTGTTSSTTNSTTDASDRFLKLLVTQMQNQDPLNPMDNAQVTSQMAQINTVTGIDKLNTTMGTMSTNITQMQMLQGAGLVGHSVLMEGNKLNLDSDRKVTAGYELAAGATNVRIDIQNAAGITLDTVTQSGKSAGRQGFSWTAPSGVATSGLTFKVTATSSGKAITSTPLMSDTVNAISNTNGALTLELQNGGSTAYSKIKAVS